MAKSTAKAMSIAAYNETQAPADKAICDALQQHIDEQLTGGEGKVWHGHPVWFLEGNPVAGYCKMKVGVRFLLWSGQSFDEPALVPEGSFKAAEMRYTDVAQVDAADMARWLQKAQDIQWDYKNLAKRKGVLERLK